MKKNLFSVLVLSVLVLSVLLLSALTALSSCGGKAPAAPAARETPAEAVPETAGDPAPDMSAPESTPLPARGTLLDSGTGLNDNYFARLDLSVRAAVNVTDSRFDLEPKALGTDEQTVTVRYDENTLVKTADLYYAEDRYEIYAGVLDDFLRLKDEPGFSVGVILDDPSAAEPYAKEIWIDSMVDILSNG